jgi:AcrR family transcriptional regulator
MAQYVNAVNIRQNDDVEQAQAVRGRYHHGDLPHALGAAAAHLAREGGPEAVVLREAARRVGVSATAAYRHFASHADLMHAVKEQAQQTLADRMEAEVAQRGGGKRRRRKPVDAALERLRALGAGYVHFALAEPGLFRTAFCRVDQDTPTDAPMAADAMLAARAYQLLSTTLDAIAEQGLIKPEHRQHAETAAWAGMHGLAVLMLDGPLRALPPAEREVAIERTIDVIIAGICRP